MRVAVFRKWIICVPAACTHSATMRLCSRHCPRAAGRGKRRAHIQIIGAGQLRLSGMPAHQISSSTNDEGDHKEEAEQAQQKVSSSGSVTDGIAHSIHLGDDHRKVLVARRIPRDYRVITHDTSPGFRSFLMRPVRAFKGPGQLTPAAVSVVFARSLI